MKLGFVAGIAAIAILAGCQTTTSTSATEPASSSVVASSGSIGDALNAARAANGRSALPQNAALTRAAQVQAQHMASTNTLTHSGPGGSTVGQRVRAQGCSFSWVGENVAVGHSSDASAMEFWMNSSGHRRNALNSAATAYGAAQVGTYRALVLAGGC